MTSSRKKIATSGLAATRQRVFILKAIQGRTDHPDAETVHQAVISSLPSISLDTVYRTLSLFAQKGLIQQLAVPTRRFRYDGCIAPHDHFLCTQCERIEDVSNVASVSNSFPEEIGRFGTVRSIQQIYVGTCHACSDNAAKAAVI